MCHHHVVHRAGILTTVVLLVLVAMATGQILKNEPECLAEGGVCAPATSCPANSTLRSGLCPQQEPDGAVCCSQIPDNVDTCHGHGGRCDTGSACDNVEKFGQLDCDEGTECCLLIF
uniref:U5-Liphistoxin-Lth1a_1 n=2 Tax=Liphistius TaxID=62150 RepID=A0A4V2H8X0_9ARAC